MYIRHRSYWAHTPNICWI